MMYQLVYSTGHEHCSTYMCITCMQYGGFPRKIHAINSCKFLHELLQADFLHANLSVFLQWMILLIKIHASCVYVFTTANVADIKLETNIVEKCLFVVKEKATYYTLSLTTILLQWQTSCFVINYFLGCWLKCYFTCKLGCMLYLSQLLFLNKFTVLACVAGARTSLHCFFFFRLVYNTCLKHGLSYRG